MALNWHGPFVSVYRKAIDDLTVESIERMKAEGFEPAVIVETSTVAPALDW